MQAILAFLVIADVNVITPLRADGPWPKGATSSVAFSAPTCELLKSDPKKGYTENALPASLFAGACQIPVSNWLEGDGRDVLKFFAGNQVAAKLLNDLLKGSGAALGVRQATKIAKEDGDLLDTLVPVGSRFGYDSRGAWDAINLGTSLDKRSILVAVSLSVEVLSSIGLENTRPQFLGTYLILYFVWPERIPQTTKRPSGRPHRYSRAQQPGPN